MHNLTDRHIILGLTGGIACYKSAELVRQLVKAGATVDVVMTEAATHFITATTMQALSGRPVYLDAWDARIPNNMAHIELSRAADLILIAPASTDFMAKLATGQANDLLSTLCVARNCPLLVAPAMNREMWANPATQRNAAILVQDGIRLLGPASGSQACGETGEGRMLEPADLMAELSAHFQPKILQGKHVLLTAGPTAEPIDPVRVLSNRSSGKTGYALARAAWEAGATVTMVSGPTALPTPYGVTRITVDTARQMHEAVMARTRDADLFIAVAAVADWHIANPSEHKLKKGKDGTPVLEFVPNPDILAEVAALEQGPWCVGFAAETQALRDHAEAKRRRKQVPVLIGNDAQSTMDADAASYTIFDDAGHTALPVLPKQEAARRLIAEIVQRWQFSDSAAGTPHPSSAA
ncbi:bifunctional phosphopantothenoylcysteine decarboxylase/phosphopantothenate--cysteine ligase CoaBC [Alcaligenaceae bacterium SJ-26]|nr:bifunctional phosphopantothenoylcysteine decarboxylase/phosphopantothenate--cysteine ligase CoaBC [Alcaligenaceae bacterium SJ-26]